MPRFQFEDGAIVEFEKEPTADDLRKAYAAMFPQARKPTATAPQKSIWQRIGEALSATDEAERLQAERVAASGKAQFEAGKEQMRQGAETFKSDKAKGASQVFRGATQAAMPVLAPIAAPALVAGGLPAIASAGIGIVASQGVEKGLKAVGAPEGVAELAGDIAGLPGYTAAGAKVAGAVFAKPKVVPKPKPAGPNIFRPQTKSVEKEVLESATVPAKTAQQSAAAWKDPNPPVFKSAKESADVFESQPLPGPRGPKTNRQQRRESIAPQDQSVPEQILRVQDRREQLAKELTGKTWDQLDNSERITIDDLITGNQPAAQPKSRPSPKVVQPKEPKPVFAAPQSVVPAAIKSTTPDEIVSALAKLESGPGNYVTLPEIRKALPNVSDEEIGKAMLQGARDEKIYLARFGTNPSENEVGQLLNLAGENFIGFARNPETTAAAKTGPFKKPVSPRRMAAQKGAVVVPVDKLRQGAQKVRTELTDRYAALRDLEKDFNIPLEESAYIGARSFGGHQGKIQDRLIDLARTVRPAKKEGYLKDALDYAVLERHEELGGRLPNYTMPNGQTLADVAAQKTAMEQRLGPRRIAQINDLNKALRDYSDTLLQEMRDGGLISDAAYQAIKKNNEKYIPFQRVQNALEEVDKVLPYSKENFSVASQDVVRSIQGSEKEIVDPLEALVKNTFKAKAAIERNSIARKMAAYADRPEFSGVVYKLKTGQRVSPTLETISYLDDGQKSQVAVPAGVAAAMKNLNKESADVITRAMAFWGRALRAGVTLDPIFMAKNTMRDFQTAVVTEGITPMDWARGMVASLTRGVDQKKVPQWLAKKGVGDDTYRQFLRSGGAFGGFYHHGNLPETAANLIASPGMKVAKTIIDPRELFGILPAMEKMGETAELASRLAVFQKAQRAGKGLQEAGWRARTGTVDFERAGTKMKIINMMVPFLNARLQGTLNLARVAKEAPMATAFRLSAVAGMPALATYFYNLENHPEEWGQIADYEKDNNYILIYGKGRNEKGDLTDAIKIPKGEVKPFVNTMIDMLEELRGTNEKDWKRIATTFLSDLSPVPFERGGKPSAGAAMSAVLPPPVKSGIQLATGKDLYTGRDIVSRQFDETASPHKRYGTETPTVFVKTAEKLSSAGLEVSPEALKHEAGTLFGHLGRKAADALPSQAKPGINLNRVLQKSAEGFVGAKAGQTSKSFERVKDLETARADRMTDVQRAADMIVRDVRERGAALPDRVNQATEQLLKAYPQLKREEAMRSLMDEIKDIVSAETEGLTPYERVLRRTPIEVRAQRIIEEARAQSDPQKVAAYLTNLANKKILTPQVREYIIRQAQAQ